ncbi:MAG: DEAD/DEAH box helicase family protein [Candidatus Riflebacteria bacterium]|nr:DEAD/DEAH box helicase family protein [Candidatus Riflebacteria bacterium]
MTTKCLFPEQFTIFTKLLKNRIIQIRRPTIEENVRLETYSEGRLKGTIANFDSGKRILTVSSGIPNDNSFDEVLFTPDGIFLPTESDYNKSKNRVRWQKPSPLNVESFAQEDWNNLCLEVRRSWENQFSFVEEVREKEAVVSRGLRPPQIGALYATLAHWKVSSEAGTVVLPTGTGKTETMLALLAHQRFERLLVIVPTDTLRDQISRKFLSFGLLKYFGVIGESSKFPIVGIIEHRFQNKNDVQRFFSCCNVVVSTMAVISRCSEEVQKAIGEFSSHLFIDEAHHIKAPTWEKFRNFFSSKTILQFTATPFRADKKKIDGKIIFNYPLHKSQKEGYFKKIEFWPIHEFNPLKEDEEIATRAIERLENDLANGFDHIILARADKISRAEKLLAVYKTLCIKFNPQLFHSKKRHFEKRTSMELLNSRESRVIICVDMFGEGFDFPQLKIAAFHDLHKGLGITLQFVGRFTRTSGNIGNASVIANVENVSVDESIKELYAEDSDWNSILRFISEKTSDKLV